MATDISDGICGYVAGGLGNQLFILAAAWQQATRLGAPLYLDTSFHTAPGTRPYELDTLAELPATVMAADSPWRSRRITKLRVIPVPLPRRPLRRRLYFERDGARYDRGINAIRTGTTLFGYFQSPLYFPDVAAGMEALITGAPETPAEREILDRVRADPRVGVHLRRGDYLDAAEDRRVISSTDYAIRSRDLLRRLGVEQPLRIFSDSPELVREELGGDGADIEIFDDGGVLSSVNTLKAMSAGPAFVMSNSTFSWWAAWLMARRDPATTVIAPRPWDESGSAKADLLDPSWISLDTR